MATKTKVSKVSAFERQLAKAGYALVRALSTRRKISDGWVDANGNPTAPLYGPSKSGQWFVVRTPDSPSADSDTALLLRQGPHCYHVFGKACWTASGSSLLTAYRGGLGDAIGTDSQMRTYCRLVSRAPETWAMEFEGLSAAKSQVWNDRNRG
jgi:hypothetical protein